MLIISVITFIFYKKAIIEIVPEINYYCAMNENCLPELSGSVIYFVGIKGTGMTALAEIFRSRGAIITGSDVKDKFYTDDILQELGIPVLEGFNESNLPPSTSMLVYSAAYSPDKNPEILKARSLGIKIISYAEALGCISRESLAAGIAGVHGKTTTTAITGTVFNEFELPFSVLTGSAASNFGGRSTLVKGDKYFIAETCEYKRNFLNFYPDYLVITSIEADHLDYYRDVEDITSAFVEYACRLPEKGRLFYCVDDAGTLRAVKQIAEQRSDLRLIPYGFSAEGDFSITGFSQAAGEQSFTLRKFADRPFTLKVPGRHNVLNSTAAAALLQAVLDDEGVEDDAYPGIAAGLLKFKGTKRRSEIVGSYDDVLVMDDYGHHPGAIKTTIAGLRDFYPDRRIIVDFMSHTYSRTEALIDDFAKAFDSADKVILHKIYASAREAEGNITGRDLYDRVCRHHKEVYYYEEYSDALDFITEELKPGDLFLTMGAGDNWKLGLSLLERMNYNKQGCAE